MVVAKQAQVLVLRVTEKVMFSHRHEKERRSEFVLSHRFCTRGLQIMSFFHFSFLPSVVCRDACVIVFVQIYTISYDLRCREFWNYERVV